MFLTETVSEGQNDFGKEIPVTTCSANRASNPVNLLYKIAVGFDLLLFNMISFENQDSIWTKRHNLTVYFYHRQPILLTF